MGSLLICNGYTRWLKHLILLYHFQMKCNTSLIKSVSTRTNHVDIRYRFVQEFVFDGFLKINFVRSKGNDADIFTKNLGGDSFSDHSRKMVIEKGKV